MLQQALKSSAFQDRPSHGDQRLSESLNIFVLGVIECAGAGSFRSLVGQLLPTLKGHLHVALAIRLKKSLAARYFEDPGGELRMDADIPVHGRRLDSLRWVYGCITTLRTEMA